MPSVIGLGAVALLVGTVGMANIMVILVLERRSGIGLRRVLGATSGHIRIQFLALAAMLSVLGGRVGIAAGSLAPFFATSRTDTAASPLGSAGPSVLVSSTRCRPH
ncbi:MAG: ABC transporter permease [Acidimicrobiales bacterium]